MEVIDVINRIAEIDEVKRDYEKAHSLEDSLRQDVLKAIARGRDPVKMRQLARTALKSTEIEFFRFCA